MLPEVPELSDAQILGKEGAYLWNKHFAPSSETDKVVQVPIEWTHFLSLALLSPDRFEWAKSLLSSQIWAYILEGSESNVFKPFVIPDECTSIQAPSCKLQTLETAEEAVQLNFSTPQGKSSSLPTDLQPSSTSAVHVNKKRKDKLPFVESEVRSERLQLINKGYKKNLCLDRNCMPCNADPPIIASEVVRNLSTSFGKIQEFNDPSTTV